MSAQRLAAIIRADFLIRLRRPSTVVVFLLLSAVPYLWIPDPSTGRALMQIAGRRALYNSATIGMATATLATIFIGLFGFYVVSNALRRDIVSRCGYVIASTTMRASEYIVGKFAGNVVFLTVFTLGFMATAMAMVLVRGEAPLQPLIFAKQYLMLAPPAIVFVSAAAILFECTPLLRTKLGDVFYFFVWIALLGSVAAMIENSVGTGWAPFFDVSGFGLLLQQMKTFYGTNSLSIGSTTFNAAKGTADFAGLHVTPYYVMTRLTSTLWPVSLLALARVFFHRFDPARVRAVPNERSRRSWMGRLNALAKPLARLFVRILAPLSRTPAMTDAVTTLAGFPLMSIGVVIFALMAVSADNAHALFTGVLPIAWAGCAIAISDIASREKRAGTTALIYAAPRLRERFVFWKFSSTLIVALAFLGVPLACAIATRPQLTPALLAGVVFTAAAATALGIVSANPKTFIVGFLSFWYVATQDKGASPELDFAGWFGTVTPVVIAAYALAAVALLGLAQLFHARELRR
ncbi:MAG TPA: hypothetical protein VND45_04150 [Thermoanaerobaculia bacterium]|jgi:hypothetical protein|nr:hypothetical protein [Thermoanaerobaculia bacterium]